MKIQTYISDTVLPKMRITYPEATIELESVAAVPSMQAADTSALAQLIRRLTQNNDIRKVAYGTEAGLFQLAGIDTLICGPGNIEQAHRPNEFVRLAELYQCEKFLRGVIAELG